MDAAREADIPVTICGLAVGNPATFTVLSSGASQFFHKPAKPAGSQKALLEAE